MDKSISDMSEEDWRQKLTPEQYRVLRQQGTEAPFSGKLLYNTKAGTYVCQACGQPLFSSDTKFGTRDGWPSFYDVAKKGNVTLKDDTSFGMHRTEVVCSNCGSHLGHLFDDAPEQPGGMHYCINSAALDFKPKTSDR